MYNFLTGPLAWFSFSFFIIGLIVRSTLYIRGLDSDLDRVTYRVNTFYGIKEAVRSVFYWLLPFGTRGWRSQPVMAVLVFIFHLGVVFTPIFLTAHIMMLNESWGVSWFSIPDSVADILTIVVMISFVFLIIRRILLAEVRILTKFSDYLMLVIAVAPFLTGFMAFHQFSNYKFWMIAHIITGEILLIAIPLTKLSHALLFFFSRAQLGMDYGIKRGGMKRKNGLAW